MVDGIGRMTQGMDISSKVKKTVEKVLREPWNRTALKAPISGPIVILMAIEFWSLRSGTALWTGRSARK
ncbi:hypothetical protein NXC12_PE00285 (plasmid) [Rhizobium etli]|uniref:Uncharacterized protein n=1 Tax=Rhizobium etli TaxID=29449 RepID=A0AAN1BMQ8_RHIET|nr:hypothetical protein REMIM1_PF00765 [Rhizobium etli bv. mimosae str. Mim1]ARQ13881.1 hypothetical protein NXC12_PE00285 [Rhizobium etli]